MKIVMVAGHACIRVQKMALPLIAKGHEVHLIAMKVPTYWEQYKTFSLCTDIEQVISSIKLHKDADVFHCHNEPSWFVWAVREVTDVPVILDVHDSYLARSTPKEAEAALDRGDQHFRVVVEERNNMQLADGLVFVGDHFKDVITSEFGLTQPALTLPSYVPKRLQKYQSPDWHGGLVYEGKVTLPSENKGRYSGFAYCDYTDMMERCHAMKMDFHLYGNRTDKNFRKHYGKKAFIHPPHNYEKLLTALGCHDWGLVGNIEPTSEWKVAMPNKLFEYLAGGTPVVAMNADYCADFIRDTKIGIIVDDPEELGSRWREHRECRGRIPRVRQEWTMDAHIHLLENFYTEVDQCVNAKANTGMRLLPQSPTPEKSEITSISDVR